MTFTSNALRLANSNHLPTFNDLVLRGNGVEELIPGTRSSKLSTMEAPPKVRDSGVEKNWINTIHTSLINLQTPILVDLEERTKNNNDNMFLCACGPALTMQRVFV